MSPVNTAFSRWTDDLEKAPQILVGFSGGLDSSVLLHSLVMRVQPKNITAIHVNHGLSKNADLWQEQARNFCKDLGVDFACVSVGVSNNGGGWENSARQARYGVFQSRLQKDGILLLGHHMDDQVETLLYRLMRGSGNKGMSGIPSMRVLGQGRLIRPFLQVRRKDIEDYANGFEVEWVEDESNSSEKFDRNFLRNSLIPSIENRWPSYRKRFSEMARLSNESDILLMDLAKQDVAKLDLREEKAGFSICLQQLHKFDLVRQKNILRCWPEMIGLNTPDGTVIAEIMTTIIGSRIDSSPKLCVGKSQYRRYSNRLYLLNADKMPEDLVKEDLLEFWKLDECFNLDAAARLHSISSIGEGLSLSPSDIVQVAYRKGGERCQPAGRNHSTSLKKCLHEYGLEPWWRDRVPLIFKDEKLIAVADLWVCEGWQVNADENGVKILWDHIS